MELLLCFELVTFKLHTHSNTRPFAHFCSNISKPELPDTKLYENPSTGSAAVKCKDRQTEITNLKGA